jgi:hypothetical protein
MPSTAADQAAMRSFISRAALLVKVTARISAAPSAPVAAADDYPLCSKSVTDHCMNPGEAPKGYAKKHRAK